MTGATPEKIQQSTGAAQSPSSSARNYGIDILRMVAMLLVVILHEISHGGLLEASQGIQHSAVLFMRCIAICAVDCFVLITGYCQINLKFKSKRLISLWSVALFYSVAVIIFLLVYHPSAVSDMALVKMLTPVVTTRWWFFTAYFFLILVSPFINHAMSSLSQRHIKIVLLVCLISLCVVPFIAGRDVMQLNSGYSFGWFVIMYVIGGSLNKLSAFERGSFLKWFAFYVILMLVMFGGAYVSETTEFGLFADSPWNVGSYISPLVLGEGIALLGAFSQLKINAQPLQKVIRFITPSVFAVYLISDHSVIRKLFMKDAFVDVASSGVGRMIATMIAVAVAVFVACILIDIVRRGLFKIAQIDKGINRLGGAIDARLLPDGSVAEQAARRAEKK